MKKLSKATLFIILVILFVTECDHQSTGPTYPSVTYRDYYAVWSEPLNLIAYFHNRQFTASDSDSSGIYIINRDGTNKYLLYESRSICGLDWSSDGQFIIANSGYALVKIFFYSGQVDTLTDVGEFWEPVWSPNGDCIAYSVRTGYKSGIYISHLDGSIDRRVVNYSDYVGWPYPDSLIYTNYDRNYPLGSICISDTSGFFGRVIMEPQSNMITGSVKPKMHRSSGKIVFSAQLPGSAESIWALDSGDKRPRQIRALAAYPNFSPSGNRIIFTDIHENNGRLYIINWDGTGLQQLTY